MQRVLRVQEYTRYHQQPCEDGPHLRNIIQKERQEEVQRPDGATQAVQNTSDSACEEKAHAGLQDHVLFKHLGHGGIDGQGLDDPKYQIEKEQEELPDHVLDYAEGFR